MVRMNRHNYTITARPRIMFATGRASSDEELWSRVYGGSVPTTYNEFTGAHLARVDEGTRNLLAALRLIARATAVPHHSEDLHAAIERLIPARPEGLRAEALRNLTQQKLPRLYSLLLNSGLGSSSLRITLKGNEPQITVVCPSISSAAFAWAAYAGVEVCPACQRLFAPNPARPKQKACSSRCGQVLVQRRYRRKVAKKKNQRRQKRNSRRRR